MKYEMKLLDCEGKSTAEVSRLLNGLGADGWQLMPIPAGAWGKILFLQKTKEPLVNDEAPVP